MQEHGLLLTPPEPEAANVPKTRARGAAGEQTLPEPRSFVYRFFPIWFDLREHLPVEEQGCGSARYAGFVNARAEVWRGFPPGGERLRRIDDGSLLSDERNRFRDGDAL